MKNKHQTISVTMASYNNEDCISRCLESVRDWVDEIIVVDGTSIDKTVEIAKSLGAKVLIRENNPIFHVQKDIANREAKSDWILQLDTDEVVTPKLKGEIISLLEGNYFGYDSWISPLKSTINNFIQIYPKPKLLDKPAAAYWLPRNNYFLGGILKHAGQYPDPIIRLFQRGKAKLPAKDVHEQMVVDGSLGWLKNDYDHHGTPTFKRYLLREDRYSSLQAAHLKENGIRINVLNTINYLLLKPFFTFINLYIRYRGLLDGFPGFIFSLYSGLHHAFSYMKLWELYQKESYDQKN